MTRLQYINKTAGNGLLEMSSTSSPSYRCEVCGRSFNWLQELEAAYATRASEIIRRTKKPTLNYFIVANLLNISAITDTEPFHISCKKSSISCLMLLFVPGSKVFTIIVKILHKFI